LISDFINKIGEAMIRKNAPILLVSILFLSLVILFSGCYVKSRDLLVRGSSYLDQKRYFDAIECFDKAIEIRPDDPVPHHARGVALYRLARDEEAIVEFNRAIELDSEYSRAYYSRGLVYKAMEDYDSALSDFCAAIEIDPKEGDYFYSRGLLFIEMDRLDEAFDDYVRACDLGMSNACLELRRLNEIMGF
jgi:tetratricopeptide (TPR) repeat protein